MKKPAAVLLFFLAIMPGFTLSLHDLIDAGRAEELLREGTIFSLQLKDPQPALLPRNVSAGQIVSRIMGDLEPSMVAESLSLYQKPDPAAWSEAERNALYNGALSLSSLAGLQYFSASRNEMRIFYETSTVIDGPESKNPLPDPSYSTPPPELTLYARQKDLTFGDNLYQYTYYAGRDSLILTQQNLTKMRYGLITAVGENKLCSLLAVIDTETHLLIYAVSMAKVISLPMLNKRVGRSFSTRLEALFTWFSGRADRVFHRAVP
ncbi:hypothetical protein LQZ21_14555 [Treponema sp. TIM-1]|uniref:DUF6675 family protein n=1 Tax=Treponema sp. TIM-1 TaxID=2898417 RepID=UPI00397FBFEB